MDIICYLFITWGLLNMKLWMPCAYPSLWEEVFHKSQHLCLCVHLVLHPCQVYQSVAEDIQSAAILQQGTGDLWSDGGSELVINLCGYFLSCWKAVMSPSDHHLDDVGNSGIPDLTSFIVQSWRMEALPLFATHGKVAVRSAGVFTFLRTVFSAVLTVQRFTPALLCLV